MRSKEQGACLLIAGTAIGAGLLALPVSTANAGFLPAGITLVLTWGTMLISSLFMPATYRAPAGPT